MIDLAKEQAYMNSTRTAQANIYLDMARYFRESDRPHHAAHWERKAIRLLDLVRFSLESKP